MKASELRIGNYFKHNGNLRLLTNNEFAIRLKFGFDGCEPIPLTEEWLFKLGLVRRFNGLYGSFSYDDYSNFEFIKSKKGYDIYKTGDEEEIYIASIVNVHEFQNLHFALIGEELKINENE